MSKPLRHRYRVPIAAAQTRLQATGTRYLIAPTGNLRPAIAKLARLFSVLRFAIANVAQQIANVAQQFSDLHPAIANAAQQIANVAQQFGIAGPQYGSVAGQLKTQPSALRSRSAI